MTSNNQPKELKQHSAVKAARLHEGNSSAAYAANRESCNGSNAATA